MAEKSTMINVYTQSDLGFYSGALGMEDEQVKNIQILANGAKELVEKNDSSAILQKYFAEKQGLTGELTPEQRDETLSLATALKRTPRVTVYELTKDDNGRSNLETKDHFVGKICSGGKEFTTVDDNGEVFRLALESHCVVHDNTDALLDAVGTQHLGINNFAEQVDTCALVAFEKAFASVEQQ